MRYTETPAQPGTRCSRAPGPAGSLLRYLAAWLLVCGAQLHAAQIPAPEPQTPPIQSSQIQSPQIQSPLALPLPLPLADGTGNAALAQASILELQVLMGTGRLSARQLVQYYLSRINRYDQQGPALNAVKLISPTVLAEADALDLERQQTGARGPLHGIPVIVKDNYETRGMPTTAGSILLADFRPDSDAHQVARLKAAGAIIFAKANMHEFAYGITTLGSGFGATRNPYAPSRNPGGSSGGTAAAVAAGFAAVGMGSDTCGSIRIPAAHNSLVGLRGTQGLSSRGGIIPLSHTQDVAGPLARSVVDLALVLDATVGFDPDDPQTAASVGKIPGSYLDGLRPDALRGARIGILEDLLLVEPEDTEVAAVIGTAMAELRSLGAHLQRVKIPGFKELINTRVNGFFILAHDFKTDINGYFSRHPDSPVASLEDILKSGEFHESIDESLRLSQAMGPESAGDYLAEQQHRLVLREAVQRVLAERQLDVLAYPSIRRKAAPLGESQPGSNCRLSANTGLPAISIPAGYTADGLPVGLELLGTRWSEPELLALAFSYEQAIHKRRPPDLNAQPEQGEQRR